MNEAKREQINRVVAFLDGKQEEMVSLLEKLVKQESGNTDKAGCDAMGAMMEQELKKLGAQTQVIAMEKKGNFVKGELGTGRSGKPVLFGGHMDTVFPKGTIETMPWKMENGRIYGPGCVDMKSGLVIALYAAAALNAAGYEERPIRFAFAGDEENGHRESTAADEFRAASRGCAAVFNFETGYPSDSIVVGRKGSCRLTVRVKGVGSHAGNAPEKGRNAILEMAHKVIALQALNDLEHGTSLNVGLITGGTAVNAVPESCEIQIDIRYTERPRLDKLLEDVKAVCGQTVIDGTSTELIVSSISDVMETTDKILALFEHYKKTAQEISYPGELHPIKVGGWSDASLAASEGIPVICGLGAKGEFNHSSREYMMADSLVPRAKLAAAAVLLLED